MTKLGKLSTPIRLLIALTLIASLVPSYYLVKTVLAADGDLDVTFGPTGPNVPAGVARTDFGGANDKASALGIQSTGKIIAGGTVGAGAATFGLSRYTTTGALDTTFGPGMTGKVTTSFGSPNGDTLNDLAIGAMDRIVTVGTTLVSFGSCTNADMAIAVYDANGNLDMGFSGDGKLTIDFFGCNDNATGVVIQPDGKIVIIGSALEVLPGPVFNDYVALVRLNADGTFDNTFNGDGNSDGKVLTLVTAANGLGTPADFVRIPSGPQVDKFIAVGGSNLSSDFFVARFKSDGILDSGAGGFGPTDIGAVTTDFNNSDSAKSVALQSDGKIIAGGVANFFGGPTQDFAMARYDSDGNLDTNMDSDPGVVFGTGGKVTTDFSSGMFAGTDEGKFVGVASNGKIIMSGAASLTDMVTTTNNVAIARYNTDGSLDNTFGSSGNGKVVTTLSTGMTTNMSAPLTGLLQPDAKILVAGQIREALMSGEADIFVARFENTGLPTTTTVASNNNPSVFGQSVTFTATVTSSGGTPTGNVNFVIDGGAPTVVALNGAGQATLTTSSLSVGNHTVMANYQGGGSFPASSGSLAGGQTVNPANTTTTVASNNNPSVFGQSVTFTATVTATAPGGGTPAGNVSFVIDGGAPTVVVLNGAGQATLTTSSLSVGNHTVAATYQGNSNYNGSNGSLAGGQTVNKASTTTAITSDNPDPSNLGQSVTVTYTVTAVAPGAGTPTGNVTVNASTGEFCMSTVAAGSCNIVLNTPGTRTLTATYAGDTNFLNSVSAGASHTVSVMGSVSGSLSDPLGCTGPGGVVTGTIQINNTAAITQPFTLTTTFTNFVGLVGTCTLTGALPGTNCSVSANGLTANGSIAANTTLLVQYQAQVADVPSGTTLTASNVATLSGAPVPPNPLVFTTTANCAAVGPGLFFPSTAEVSDQKAGSVLVYNLYSSSIAAPNSQNTRIAITNTNPSLPIAVHLFFVDGATCSIADSLVCLTPNQTASFLASDIDPGTTGYIVAVASDLVTGCPVDFNYLIGDEYVKLSSGHAANLTAEGFAAIAGGLPACNGLSVTALLSFDGTSYNRAPRVLAASNIPSRADGNDTLIVINRFGGSLAAGAGTLGSLFGILYDDAENPLSFTFTAGVCQFRSSLSSNFPRVAPRFEQFIPAGRSGWAKFYSQSDIALLGAQINFNVNAGTAANAFNQGHNLHKLTLTTTAVLTIPIFPPNC